MAAMDSMKIPIGKNAGSRVRIIKAHIISVIEYDTMTASFAMYLIRITSLT